MANSKQILATSLNAQTVLIPDLISLLPDWHQDPPYGLVEEVNCEIDNWLKTINIDEYVKQKYRTKGNMAMLAVCYYPRTRDHDKLVELSKHLYWGFLWDDDIDQGGELAKDTLGAGRRLSETKACVDKCLSPDVHIPVMVPSSAVPIVAAAYPIFLTFREAMALDSLERLRLDLHGWIDAATLQQTLRMGTTLPNVQDYLSLRRLDVGMTIQITLGEYARSFALPQEVYESAAMQKIVRLSIMMTLLVNDLHSLQKELGAGQLENIVVLLVAHESLSLQEAVWKVIEMIKENYERFGQAEKELGIIDEKGTGVSWETWEYVLGTRSMVMGTIQWALRCERYFAQSQINEKGEVLLKLRVPCV